MKGFTLIELLVVVAIIALLISILLPSLSRAKEAARRVACAADVRSISQASALYLHDTGFYAHPQLFPEQLGIGEFSYDSPGIKLKGTRMIGADENSEVWDCPNAVKPRLSWKDPLRQGWDVRYAFNSYGGNDWGLGENNFNIEESPPDRWARTGMFEYYKNGADYWGVREGHVAQPGKWIVYTESNRDGLWDQLGAQDQNDWCWGNGEAPGAIHPVGTTYGVNTGFFDGHVEWQATFTQGEVGRTTRDRLLIAGILISDGPARFFPNGDREPWRMMWSRDHKPHLDIPD